VDALPDVHQKSASGGHFRRRMHENCCLMLHAEKRLGVYNREVIPCWKERFGGASATGA
jgi:hypothetical protein